MRDSILFRANPLTLTSVSMIATLSAVGGYEMASLPLWLASTATPILVTATWWIGGKVAHRLTRPTRDLHALFHGACPDCMFVAVGEVSSDATKKTLYCGQCDEGYELIVGPPLRVNRLGKTKLSDYKAAP